MSESDPYPAQPFLALLIPYALAATLLPLAFSGTIPNYAPLLPIIPPLIYQANRLIYYAWHYL